MSNDPNEELPIAPQPTTNPDHVGDNPAAHERVTSGELTQALTQIEARKEAEAQRLAGTIPLGQAVEDLGLEVTPEELLAEVRALRQSAKPSRAEQPSVASPGIAEPPPPSSDAEAAAPPLTHCPACSRRLLTQASALCNWCGAKINDPHYQEQAARSRQTLDQSELSQLETLVQEETRYGIFGRLKRRAKQNPGSKKTLG